MIKHTHIATDLVTGPVNPVISTVDAKLWLRVDDSSEDALIDSLVAAATRRVEKYIGKKLINQTWDYWLDRFPVHQSDQHDQWWDGVRDGAITDFTNVSRFIDLPFDPLESLTSFTVYNEDDSSSLVSSSIYGVDTQSAPGRIYLNEGQVWPVNLRDRSAIQIRAVYGYGTLSTDIPEDVTQAVKMIMASMYENRGGCDDGSKGGMPSGAVDLLSAHRLLKL